MSIGSTADEHELSGTRHFWALVIGSIGVVFGDIGTSPLYAFREAVNSAQGAGISNREVVVGVLSMILWALTLIVTIKYVFVLLRIDNKGEGGTFALMALGQSVAKRSAPIVLALGIAGAAFFYGDAVITPAISVLSAVEGLNLISPSFQTFVLPLSLIILIILFAMQSRGTARVANVFGPITACWFVAIAVGGLIHLVDDPSVLAALDPLPGVEFAASHGVIGLTVMGLVFLSVTGAEALYADLGHFGRKPISFAWMWLVFPSLALNYLGQGSLVLANPSALENPFFRLYPGWALFPMIVLATLATVIASQAVITGAFSLTRQAVQLNLIPRLEIRHTSEAMAGQIYLPRINWLLLVSVLFVVIVFRDLSHLAAAYGVSVTATMVITSLMAFFIIWKLWGWSIEKAAALILPLLFIELSFFLANMLKVVQGGWLPLAIAACVSLAMTTWIRGFHIVRNQFRENEAELDWLVRKLEAKPPHRVPGTAVFLSPNVNAAPIALMHNLKHNRILHERNIILTIQTIDTPRVPSRERIEIDHSNEEFVKITARYGFMETPSISRIFTQCRRKSLNVDMGSTSFFVSRRVFKTTPKSKMPKWQEMLFIMLARKAEDATVYFQIPFDRVVEVGAQVTV